jgi:hypothetical protein
MATGERRIAVELTAPWWRPAAQIDSVARPRTRRAFGPDRGSRRRRDRARNRARRCVSPPRNQQRARRSPRAGGLGAGSRRLQPVVEARDDPEGLVDELELGQLNEADAGDGHDTGWGASSSVSTTQKPSPATAVSLYAVPSSTQRRGGAIPQILAWLSPRGTQAGRGRVTGSASGGDRGSRRVQRAAHRREKHD